MKTLPEYAKTLLLMGASTTGTFTEGYYYVEEGIQVHHAKRLSEFCQWIDDRIGGAGRGNIDMLYAAFSNPQDKELAGEAHRLSLLIQELRG